MAYNNLVAVPELVTQGIAGVRIWRYSSADAATLVQVNGYFTDGYKRGMRVGDIVFVEDNDASPRALTSHIVHSASITTVDLTAGVAVSGTNSD